MLVMKTETLYYSEMVVPVWNEKTPDFPFDW